mgnify:CR=1 FL=1
MSSKGPAFYYDLMPIEDPDPDILVRSASGFSIGTDPDLVLCRSYPGYFFRSVPVSLYVGSGSVFLWKDIN